MVLDDNWHQIGFGASVYKMSKEVTDVIDMYRELIEKSNDIILITDRNFIVKFLSGPIERLLGYDRDDIMGRELFEFVDQKRKINLDLFLDASDEAENKLTEVSLQTLNGSTLYFDVTISNLIENKEINGLVLNLHDITERKLTAQKLIKANNELDHFIYKTSHDLRAPLLSSLGLVELMERDKLGDQEEYIRLIKKSLLQLDGFIDDINSFYRNDKLAIRKEEVNLKVIAEEEIERLSHALCKKKVTLKTDITQIAKFVSDSIRIRTVITNILSNAIKYSDDEKSSSNIFFTVRVTPENCVIKIEDNGIGIRHKYLDNIFDIFYRADDNAKGSGLGLYIVKDTVDKLDGRIEVESEYGEGTTFTVTIPNFLN